MSAFTHKTGLIAATGDNTIIDAKPGYRIKLKKYQVQNLSGTGTTVLVKVGSSTLDRVLLNAQGDMLSVFHDAGEELILAENTALKFNLSGDNSHAYVVIWQYTDVSEQHNVLLAFVSPSVSASPSVSPSVSVSPSASPSVSPSASPSASPSVSPSASPSVSPSASPSAS